MANGTPSPTGPRVETHQASPPQRTKTTILHQFALEVDELPDGGRQINVVCPDLSVISLPMPADMAVKLGERLIAPSVHVPRNGMAAVH